MSGRDGPNPLRPYHIPSPQSPPVDSVPDVKLKDAAARPSTRTGPTRNAPSRLGSSARDMLPELDYSDLLSDASPSVTEMIKSLMDQGLWKYTSVLLSQPFEVAKTVLQVQDAAALSASVQAVQVERRSRLRSETNDYSSSYHVDFSSDSDDSQAYFTSNVRSSSPKHSARSRRRRTSSPASSSASHSSRPHHHPRHSHHRTKPSALSSTSSITSVHSFLWAREGAWGVWKGTNSTFVYGVLAGTMTSFLRSLFCALLALPDPSGPSSSSSSSSSAPTLLPAASPFSTLTRLEILSSPAPGLSVLAAALASGIPALLLSPVDIARTRIILTPTTRAPRSLLATLRSLFAAGASNVWSLAAMLAPATLLHSTLPALFSATTPLFLRARLGIDPVASPTAYAAATFCMQLAELFVRLPVETVLRRGQVAVAATASAMAAQRSQHQRLQTLPQYHQNQRQQQQQQQPFETTVAPGQYHGLLGTMYHIVFEEGTTRANGQVAKADEAEERRTMRTDTLQKPPPSFAGNTRKGQGVQGLWRGWRVGVWGLIGVWGAGIVGGGSAADTTKRGGEF